MDTPPVCQEWLAGLSMLLTGILLERGAAWLSHESLRARNRVVAAGAVLAIGAAAAHYPPLREIAGPWIGLPGGEASLACLGAMLLLGAAGAEPKRSARRPLLTVAIAVVFLLLTTLSSGALGWHYFGRRLRANYPDARGALQQTTGITCAPAAAAMLLSRYGIRVSEGELAELANTNLLQGTSPYALARAVDRVARRRGLRGRVQRVGYAGAARLARPFVAFVKRPGVGGHALCVLQLQTARVRMLDPLSGSPDELSRAEFVAEWDPVIVWVDGAAEGSKREHR